MINVVQCVVKGVYGCIPQCMKNAFAKILIVAFLTLQTADISNGYFGAFAFF